MSSPRVELWIWSNLVEAVRALDAVTDSLPPAEDERAWRIYGELDQLRADVERRIFAELGLAGAIDRVRGDDGVQPD